MSFFISSLSLGAGWSASYHACMLGDTKICTPEVRKTVTAMMLLPFVRDYREFYDEKYSAICLNNKDIKDLSPLSDLYHLRSLEIRKNRIEDLTPIKNLQELTLLDIQENKISNLSGIEKMLKLKRLTADNNKISKLDSLEALVSLETLNLSNNNIGDISSLHKLPELIILDIHGNPVESQAFDQMNGHRKLTFIDDVCLVDD